MVDRVERVEIPADYNRVEPVYAPERPEPVYARPDPARESVPDFMIPTYTSYDRPAGGYDAGRGTGLSYGPGSYLPTNLSYGFTPSERGPGVSMPANVEADFRNAGSPQEELSLWEKFKRNMGQTFTGPNMMRNLATSAVLSAASGGTATLGQLLTGVGIGGIAGAAGKTAADELPESYKWAGNVAGATVAGGVGGSLSGGNFLTGAAAGGLSRGASDVVSDVAGGGDFGRLAGAAAGGAVGARVYGGDTSAGAERGVQGAMLAGGMRGAESAGGEGRAGAGQGGMSDMARLFMLGRGVYGMRQAKELEAAGAASAGRADPWGAGGGRALADAQLKQLMQDPSQQAATDPAFRLRMQAAQRGAAIHGQDSGAMAVAAANASTDWYNQRLQQLGGSAGANINPGTAEELRLRSQLEADKMRQQSMATLGYGFNA